MQFTINCPLEDGLLPSHEKRGVDQTAFRYVLAVVAVGAAFLLRQVLVSRYGLNLPALVFIFPVIMAGSLLCGLWPGLLATAFAAVLTDMWVFPHTGLFGITRAADAATLIIFCCMGAFMSVVAERYRRNQRRLAGFERVEALREHKEQLDQLTEYHSLAVEAANLGAWDRVIA
jgi:K+-sensing histidine kinase KdpD